ncbi:hypothetical protein, partial [Pseudomonas gingeri]|uniref:hypothetical protein n=1 Tax=Pseudomonas gingeri TaxID=117681 RepID=UPI001C4DB625
RMAWNPQTVAKSRHEPCGKSINRYKKTADLVRGRLQRGVDYSSSHFQDQIVSVRASRLA